MESYFSTRTAPQRQSRFLGRRHVSKKLWKIVRNREVVRQMSTSILLEFLNRFHGNAVILLLLAAKSRDEHRIARLQRSKSPAVSKSGGRKLTQIERVSFLLFNALISLHLLRAVHNFDLVPSSSPFPPNQVFHCSRKLPLSIQFRSPFSLLFSIRLTPFCSRPPPYPIAIFPARPAFFWERSRSRCCRAIAQMLTQPEFTRGRSFDYLANLSGQVRMYVHLIHLQLETLPFPPTPSPPPPPPSTPPHDR